MNAMKVAMLDVLTLTRASCAAPMTFYDSFAATMGLFVGLSVAGIFGLAWWDGRQRRARRRSLQHSAPALPMDMTALPHPIAGRRSTESSAPRSPRDSAQESSAVVASRPSRVAAQRRRRSSMAVVADVTGVADVHEGIKRLRWTRVFASMSMFWLLCYPGVSVKRESREGISRDPLRCWPLL